MNERLERILNDYINGDKISMLGDQLLKYRRDVGYCEDWKEVQICLSEFIDNPRWNEDQLRLKLRKYIDRKSMEL